MLTWIQNLLNPNAASQSASTAASTLQTLASTQPLNTATHTPSVSTVDSTPQQKMALRSAKLIMVSPDNNNKFYDMSENSDGTFSVVYGRVGTKGAIVSYPMSQWDTKINEKKRKGYKDQTHLFAVNAPESNIQLNGITCEQVRQIIKDLMNYAKQSISHNYVVSADKVTRQQVEEAQAVLDRLVGAINKTMKKEDFNNLLIELFQVIPRRMANVRDHLIKDIIDLKALEEQLAEEQATLDVMRGQVEINEKQKGNDNQVESKQINVLEAMGMTMDIVEDDKTIKLIKKMMGDNSSKFNRAFRVSNTRTENQFNRFVKEVKNPKTTLFWHGSRNENWLSILKTGLVLRPANAVISGKMFGYGLYFADKFQKSLNYTSLRGSFWAGGTSTKAYLALYEVHTGNQLHIKKHEPWCGQLTESRLKDKGQHYDSVFAQGGADLINNEYIVYNEAQCTVKYIVEVRC